MVTASAPLAYIREARIGEAVLATAKPRSPRPNRCIQGKKSRKNWTAEDLELLIQILRQNPNASSSLLAKMFQRSPNAMSQKRIQLRNEGKIDV